MHIHAHTQCVTLVMLRLKCSCEFVCATSSHHACNQILGWPLQNGIPYATHSYTNALLGSVDMKSASGQADTNWMSCCDPSLGSNVNISTMQPRSERAGIGTCLLNICTRHVYQRKPLAAARHLTFFPARSTLLSVNLLPYNTWSRHYSSAESRWKFVRAHGVPRRKF